MQLAATTPIPPEWLLMASLFELHSRSVIRFLAGMRTSPTLLFAWSQARGAQHVGDDTKRLFNNLCINVHRICGMRTDPLHTPQSADIARRLDEAGFTQQALAEMLGVSQSQVSRTLNGQFKRRSKLFDDLCKIAYQSSTTSVAVQPGTSAQQADLISALDAVWDGTDSHAKALAVVIRSLSALLPSPAGLADASAAPVARNEVVK